jgi:hypothetical protein
VRVFFVTSKFLEESVVSVFLFFPAAAKSAKGKSEEKEKRKI